MEINEEWYLVVQKPVMGWPMEMYWVIDHFEEIKYKVNKEWLFEEVK